MPHRVSAAVTAFALLAAVPASASTFVSVFDFNWSGSVGTDGIWGITASSEFIDPYPDDDPRFDQASVAYTVSGRIDIVGTPGTSFTRENVIALNLDVMTGGYRLASYSFAKEDLRIGVLSGEIITTPLGAIEAELSAFRLMQNVDPTDPLQKFEQIFGCPTITDSCGSGTWSTPVPAYLSGNPTPPLGLGTPMASWC